MSSRINSTVSTPSIIVKLEGKTNNPGKKLPLPNDLNNFMRQIESRFGLNENIISLYTENGESITDVSQIFPSTTIIASTQPMHFDNSNDASDDPRFQQSGNFNYQHEDNASYNSSFEEEEDYQINPSKSQISNQRKEKDDDDDEFQESQIKSTNSKSQISNQRKQNDDGYPKYQIKSSKSQFQNQKKQNDDGEYQKSQIKYSKSQYSSQRKQKDEDNYQNSSKTIPQKDDGKEKTSSKLNQSSALNEANQSQQQEESMDYDEIPENDEEGFLQSDEEGNQEAPNQQEVNQASEKMLGPQFQDPAIKQMVNQYFESMDPRTQNFYLQASAEENLEQRYQFQNLISSLVHPTNLIEKDGLILYDKIIERIDSIINHHRTITDGCVAYNFKTIIVGPRNSGKSTLLSFLTERFLMELSTAQIWKRNFIFVFDAKKLASSFSNYLDFYDTYVDMIFNSLQIQRPGFVPYVESICNYFKSIPRSKEQLQPIPKRLETNEDFRLASRSLKQIAVELFKCARDSTAFMAWHTNVLLLPSLVSSAFGFTQIHYIIDNAEYLDAQFTPLEPFTGVVDPVDIVEYFKYAISNSSFCISCESMFDFLDIYGPRDDSVDLIRDAEFVDVFGFDANSVNGKDMAFLVKFEGDKRTFKFTIEDCGGCPAYLAFWDEMCFEVEQNQNDWNIGIESYNEQQLAVKNSLEFILKSVFVVEDEDDDLEKIVHTPIQEIHPTKTVA